MPEQLSFFGGGQLRRLFFAIQPDGPASSRVAELTEQLRARGALSGKPVEPERLHVSLHHVGDFMDQMPRRLVADVSGAARTIAMEPFEVAFDRAGGTKGPFILRASDDVPVLQSFRKSLNTALARAGFKRTLRARFTPHVTLSYSVNTAAERRIAPVSWTVRDFVLIESLYGKHQYVLRGRWPFQQR